MVNWCLLFENDFGPAIRNFFCHLFGSGSGGVFGVNGGGWLWTRPPPVVIPCRGRVLLQTLLRGDRVPRVRPRAETDRWPPAFFTLFPGFMGTKPPSNIFSIGWPNDLPKNDFGPAAKRPFASVEGNVRPRSREPCYNDASWHNGLGLGRIHQTHLCSIAGGFWEKEEESSSSKDLEGVLEVSLGRGTKTIRAGVYVTGGARSPSCQYERYRKTGVLIW